MLNSLTKELATNEKGLVMDTKEMLLFTYSTRQLTQTEKVKFHYSLKGRNSTPGMLEKVNGQHIGSAVILIPKEKEDFVVEFFKQLKIPFTKKVMLVKDEK